ncbi:58aa024b-67ae-4514-b258-730f31ed508d [Thermothielavioides terrestris]|uniref:58aa024b-67ae-4514-b258-730f31ed508d n=1 Tax=Thermothielavioides terrestris TaxID=2587410 RepID=A0A3S4F483_9PEZI|nr:58aa024b-67ae-4514-b258-730f31ed508d [Thermothielavioides terrestris]
MSDAQVGPAASHLSLRGQGSGLKLLFLN